MTRLAIASVFLLVLMATLARGEEAESSARKAVAKALPYLADEGEIWMEERKCASCHHVGLLVWGATLAAERGIAVERDRLAEWSEWLVEYQLAPRVDAKGRSHPGINAEGDLEGTGQLIFSTVGQLAAKNEAAWEILQKCFVEGLEEEGFWKAGGQLSLQKRPLTESNAVSTAWHVMALDALPGSDGGARKDALAWLAKFDAAEGGKQVSTEWAAVRVLIAKRFQTQAEVRVALDGLTKLQNDDGGWSWRSEDESDALATGQALYALGEAGGAAESVARGREFLVKTQQEDGSWRVLSTKAKTQHRATDISNYYGSAWAVIGLCRGLPVEG